MTTKTKHGHVMTPTERKRGERERMRDAGFGLRQIWVHGRDWPRVQRYLRIVNARRKRPKVD